MYLLNLKLRAKAFSDIELLKKMGSELKEPYVKSIKGKNNKGLYELRVKFSSDIVRIFYFTYYNRKFVLLHGFIKKTMKTPEDEIKKQENIWRIIKGGLLMDRVGISFEEMKADMLKDEEFKTEYEKWKPRYEAIEQIIRARKEQNITQSELAKRVGTQKSNISRLESGNYNPSLDFLAKIAESLGKKISVTLN